MSAAQAAVNTKVHLFSGFLGTGKTTAIKSLLAQKPEHEKWVIIVNEFGEIGIDGAVLTEDNIPVAEISGGCLCCVAGPQMTVTVTKMLRENRPDRLIIEASGLAHAASVIDELNTPPLSNALTTQFRERAAKLFPPKALVAEVNNAQVDLAWLDTPVIQKPRYRLHTLPDNTMGYQSQGFTFDKNSDFDGERLTQFFNDLPLLTEGLVRAKGVFRVLGTWVWLNWVDGQWGANQVSWRRDSRFELIAKSFDADKIEQVLQAALER